MRYLNTRTGVIVDIKSALYENEVWEKVEEPSPASPVEKKPKRKTKKKEVSADE